MRLHLVAESGWWRLGCAICLAIGDCGGVREGREVEVEAPGAYNPIATAGVSGQAMLELLVLAAGEQTAATAQSNVQNRIERIYRQAINP